MISAADHIRPMRGGAQSHLIRASDGYLYVVKFGNNPQDRRVLPNEWIASHIARSIGLPCPEPALIDVSPEFVAASPGLLLRIGGRLVPCEAGIQFGSRYVADDLHHPISDYLPEPQLERVANLRDFVGMLVFDKWLCNCDARQVVFCRRPHQRMRAHMIDHGFCFDAGNWEFPDLPQRGLYSKATVYRTVAGWEEFEPWLGRAETFDPATLRAVCASVPDTWEHNRFALDRLAEALIKRRSTIRSLIEAAKYGPRAPFSSWGAAAA